MQQTWVPGTSGHSWQAIAAGGTSIAIKGVQVAAKTPGPYRPGLVRKPGPTLVAAKEELLKAQGEDFVYTPLVGDRAPPLDFRK